MTNFINAPSSENILFEHQTISIISNQMINTAFRSLPAYPTLISIPRVSLLNPVMQMQVHAAVHQQQSSELQNWEALLSPICSITQETIRCSNEHA